jgi:hypothetical protein
VVSVHVRTVFDQVLQATRRVCVCEEFIGLQVFFGATPRMTFAKSAAKSASVTPLSTSARGSHTSSISGTLEAGRCTKVAKFLLQAKLGELVIISLQGNPLPHLRSACVVPSGEVLDPATMDSETDQGYPLRSLRVLLNCAALDTLGFYVGSGGHQLEIRHR